MANTNEITKALRDIAKAVEGNETIDSVKVIINIKKAKPSKATKESK